MRANAADFISAMLQNPFSFLGASWIVIPVGFGILLSVLAMAGYPETLLKWNTWAKKAGLPKLLFTVACYNIFIAGLWYILHFLKVI